MKTTISSDNKRFQAVPRKLLETIESKSPKEQHHSQAKNLKKKQREETKENERKPAPPQVHWPIPLIN